jgi:hypothetical protein
MIIAIIKSPGYYHDRFPADMPRIEVVLERKTTAFFRLRKSDSALHL